MVDQILNEKQQQFSLLTWHAILVIVVVWLASTNIIMDSTMCNSLQEVHVLVHVLVSKNLLKSAQ